MFLKRLEAEPQHTMVWTTLSSQKVKGISERTVDDEDVVGVDQLAIDPGTEADRIHQAVLAFANMSRKDLAALWSKLLEKIETETDPIVIDVLTAYSNSVAKLNRRAQ